MAVNPSLLGINYIKKHNLKSKDGSLWDTGREQNPDVSGEQSRDAFTFNCYNHPIGIFFQETVKKRIISTIGTFHSKFKYEFSDGLNSLRDLINNSIDTNIGNEEGGVHKKDYMYQLTDLFLYAVQNPDKFEKALANPAIKSVITFAHEWIKRVYCIGGNAYTYWDNRLKLISDTLHNNIPTIFKKSDVILKIVDVCVFLMKEDIYYRPRFILIFQEIRESVTETQIKTPLISCLKDLCEVCKNFEMTEAEKENLERFG